MEENQKGKTPGESEVIMTELVLPAQTNLLGNLLGGQLMHLMDIAGALVCKRHSGHQIATVAVDHIEFKHPVKLGDIVTIKAKMVWAGRTSMKVKIEATTEDVVTKAFVLTNTAYFTFVALDNNAKPVEIIKLLPQTDDEKNVFDREQEKYLQRKK